MKRNSKLQKTFSRSENVFWMWSWSYWLPLTSRSQKKACKSFETKFKTPKERFVILKWKRLLNVILKLLASTNFKILKLLAPPTSRSQKKTCKSFETKFKTPKTFSRSENVFWMWSWSYWLPLNFKITEKKKACKSFETKFKTPKSFHEVKTSFECDLEVIGFHQLQDHKKPARVLKRNSKLQRLFSRSENVLNVILKLLASTNFKITEKPARVLKRNSKLQRRFHEVKTSFECDLEVIGFH